MIQFIGLTNIPEIKPGDKLASIVLSSLSHQHLTLTAGDILIIAQKIVSKAEGRLVNLEQVTPSEKAIVLAQKTGHQAAHMEVILREASEVLRCETGVVITRTHHGFICANSGVDASNVPGKSTICLLPVDPDLSASNLRKDIVRHTGFNIPVIVSDTFGRPWRQGAINIAIGLSGINPLKDYRGKLDSEHIPLKSTQIAIADELACAAELVMNKLDRVPAVIARGYPIVDTQGSVKNMLRSEEDDLFL